MPIIRQYKDTTDRIQVVELWRNVFGYETAHNEPNLAISKKIATNDGLFFVAVENTDSVHNLVVCTLCSCYPWPLLGIPPGWYKSDAYRARAVREPRKVLAEFGVALPDRVAVKVWDSTAEIRYLVVPQRPAGTEGWDVKDLAKLITRDAMIGTGLVAAPS